MPDVATLLKEAAAEPSRGPDLEAIQSRARRRRRDRRMLNGAFVAALAAGMTWAAPTLIEKSGDMPASPVGPAGRLAEPGIPSVDSAAELRPGYLPEGFALAGKYDAYFEERPVAAPRFFSRSYGAFSPGPSPTPGQKPNVQLGITASRAEVGLAVDALARFVPGARIVEVRGRRGILLPAVSWGSIPPGGGHLAWQERDDLVVDVEAQGGLGGQGLLDVAGWLRFPLDGGLAFVLDRVPKGLQETGSYDSARQAGGGTALHIPWPRGLTLSWVYGRGGSPGATSGASRLWISLIHAPPRDVVELLEPGQRIEPVTVRGHNGLLARSKAEVDEIPGEVGETVLAWSEREGIFIKITVTGLADDELLEIAEGLELR